MERQIIRDTGATQPITTNLIGAWPFVDYWRFAEVLDFVADDSYPDPRDPDAFRGTAFARDLMRSLKPGRPWILMEQAPNAVNWRLNNAPKAPGQMAAFSMQAVARGADGVLFFQWRQAAAGAEKFHSAMLPHAGPDTRTYREVEKLGADLAAITDLPVPGGEARVAIVLDWDSWWAIDQPDHPAQFDYLAHLQGWHAALHERNVQADIVRPGGPFAGYDLVIAPSLYLLRDTDAAALSAFVEAGGRLLVTAFSDVVDEHDRLLPGGFTTRLRAALGLFVTDFDGVLDADGRTVTFGESSFAADILAEVIHLDGAEVLGTFDNGDPAVTRHAYGEGEAYYVATMADAAGRAAVVAHLVERAGIAPVLPGLPAGVEASARGDVVTVINHTPAPVDVLLPTGAQTLEPFGYRLLRP